MIKRNVKKGRNRTGFPSFLPPVAFMLSSEEDLRPHIPIWGIFMGAYSIFRDGPSRASRKIKFRQRKSRSRSPIATIPPSRFRVISTAGGLQRQQGKIRRVRSPARQTFLFQSASESVRALELKLELNETRSLVSRWWFLRRPFHSSFLITSYFIIQPRKGNRAIPCLREFFREHAPPTARPGTDFRLKKRELRQCFTQNNQTIPLRGL